MPVSNRTAGRPARRAHAPAAWVVAALCVGASLVGCDSGTPAVQQRVAPPTNATAGPGETEAEDTGVKIAR